MKALFNTGQQASSPPLPVLKNPRLVDRKFNQKRVVNIWTDGSCLAERRVEGKRVLDRCGGWGWYRVKVTSKGTKIKRGWGHQTDTTISRMELLAVIRALKRLKPETSVQVYTDSQYVQKGVTERLEKWSRNGFKKENKVIPNSDLWIELTHQLNRLWVKITWVKGHAGNHGNEEADKLAAKGRKKALRLKAEQEQQKDVTI